MAEEYLNMSTNVEADRRSPTKPTAVGVEQPLAVIEEIGKASPSGDRSSPETNCAICLGKPQNKSFTDSCLHQFCFTCLLEWSKVCWYRAQSTGTFMIYKEKNIKLFLVSIMDLNTKVGWKCSLVNFWNTVVWFFFLVSNYLKCLIEIVMYIKSFSINSTNG